MNLGVVPHQKHAYTVTTPVYEGPLDLLLQLIERAELDITVLALAQVTDQYLEHLRDLPAYTAEEVSAFLVIAAKLLQIKSEALLPRPLGHDQNEEEGPGEALAHQLRIYKRFKEIAEYLGQRESANLRTYLRLGPPQKVEGKIDLNGLTLNDLVVAAHTVFKQADERKPLGAVVAAPRFTIREKISSIALFLKQYGRGTFRQLLNRRPFRLEVVVTFLAMLELIKLHLIRVRQENIFGEIEIEPNEEWDAEDDSFELEFGE